MPPEERRLYAAALASVKEDLSSAETAGPPEGHVRAGLGNAIPIEPSASGLTSSRSKTLLALAGGLALLLILYVLIRGF